MSKGSNLNYQLQTCLNQNFRLHFDKHADKKNYEADNSHLIKSVQSKQNLSDFARTFTNWLKAEGYTKEIKMVKDIDSTIVQKFIDSKIAEGCSLKTLECYQSYFRKFEKVILKTFGCKVDYSSTIDRDKISTAPTLKDYAFTREELEKICDVKKMSESLAVIKFNIATGSRIQMCEKIRCRDIFITGDEVRVLFLKDKGGRNREIIIKDAAFADYCKELKKGKMPQDLLFNVKKDSVNQWLYRRCKSLGIEKSGNHSIRKYWAEDRCEKYGIKQTLKDLGHGEERKALIDTYTHALH